MHFASLRQFVSGGDGLLSRSKNCLYREPGQLLPSLPRPGGQGSPFTLHPLVCRDGWHGGSEGLSVHSVRQPETPDVLTVHHYLVTCDSCPGSSGEASTSLPFPGGRASGQLRRDLGGGLHLRLTPGPRGSSRSGCQALRLRACVTDPGVGMECSQARRECRRHPDSHGGSHHTPYPVPHLFSVQATALL